MRVARFTGYHVDGGYAAVHRRGCALLLPAARPVQRRASGSPAVRGLDRLSCPALGGRRPALGIYGFGAAAHIVARSRAGRDARCSLSPGRATWRRSSSRASSARPGPAIRRMPPPDALDSAIIFAPVGALVPAALRAVDKGGRVVCAGIHMSDIPTFPYSILWGERSVQSVANLTRRDGEEFLALRRACRCERTWRRCRSLWRTRRWPKLREGGCAGAAVLVP